MSAGRRRGNALDGRTWTRHSVSVWSDVRKTKEELALEHPALFPVELPRRLIECYLPPEAKLVLDPFCGLGSTVLAAHGLGRVGLGLDINPEYARRAQERLGGCREGCQVVRADAADLLDHVEPQTVDLVVTSPPYWNVLTRRRTADRKAIRNYGDDPGDLGRVGDYQAFLSSLTGIFGRVLEALRPGAYCIVIVMDLRQRSTFYPLHADLSAAMQEIGYVFDDIIIWDRRQEYNNFRPLGYPSVFRINKAHEYVLVFQKPRDGATSGRGG